MSKILAMYDVMQIQEFVFSSGKLKENVGASGMVQKVWETYLIEAIETVCNNYDIDWKKDEDLRIKDPDSPLEAEVVYIGGGNAMVAYKEETIFKDVNRHLAVKILEETGGTILFAVAGINTDFSNCPGDRKKVIKRLSRKKRRMVQTSPLMGTAVTREGGTDGLPAQHIEPSKDREGRKEFISFPAKQKRKYEEEESFKKLLESPSKYLFPKEFDNLGQREGNSHIAVIHIDGNNMGKKMDAVKHYGEMRSLSRQITEKYEGIMMSIIEEVIESLKDANFFKTVDVKFGKNEKGEDVPYLPIRSIVLNGDDVTFVTDGRIGIPLAEAFLKKIGGTSINVDGKEIQLSACAGVVIVKSHFPFYRAYQLAGELCDSAKLKAKILAGQPERNEVGNWLDFHIVYSGVTTDLSQIRNRYYNVPAMNEVDELKYPAHAKHPEMKQAQYNLLWRPWCVSGECEEKYRWTLLKKILNHFKTDNNWSRSKLKKLRNQSIKSKAEIEMLLVELKSRKMELPEFEKKEEPKELNYFRENQSPYFDALELLDFYLEVPGKEGAK